MKVVQQLVLCSEQSHAVPIRAKKKEKQFFNRNRSVSISSKCGVTRSASASPLPFMKVFDGRIIIMWKSREESFLPAFLISSAAYHLLHRVSGFYEPARAKFNSGNVFARAFCKPWKCCKSPNPCNKKMYPFRLLRKRYIYFKYLCTFFALIWARVTRSQFFGS